MKTDVHAQLAEFLTSAVNDLTQHLADFSPFLAEKFHESCIVSLQNYGGQEL